MDIGRFSTFDKFILSTAYILSFLGILKSKLGGVADAGGSDTGMRMMERLKTKAELLWIREAQSGGIKEWREQFMMFLDDNEIWRCGGHLHNAVWPMMYFIQFCCLRITLLLFWLSGELIRESCTQALRIH